MNATDRTDRSIPRMQAACLALTALLLMMVSGCMFRDIRDQVSQMESACRLDGRILAETSGPGPWVVVLAEHDDNAPGGTGAVVDHFLMTAPGHWRFVTTPDTYRLLAFRDADADLVLDDTESLYHRRADGPLDCGSGVHHRDIVLAGSGFIPPRQRPGVSIDRGRPRADDLPASLGQATAYGMLTDLDDPRFDEQVALDSLWRPVDFLRAGNAGVYFLSQYDPGKTPVLFIHGINGSPRVFTDIIDALDKDRYQPWVYYYPSGIDLTSVVDHLTGTLLELEIRHDVDAMHVVAHSMGGLVARAFLLRREQRDAPADIPVFVSLATPWDGHGAARLGVDYAPTAAPVWYDMAPGSDFLHELFWAGEYGAPDRKRRRITDTDMALLFSYKRTAYVSQASNDGVIAVSSLLRPEAQDEASSIRGYHVTHMGILADAGVIEMVMNLLAEGTRE